MVSVPVQKEIYFFPFIIRMNMIVTILSWPQRAFRIENASLKRHETQTHPT